jgi:hypothetical protein
MFIKKAWMLLKQKAWILYKEGKNVEKEGLMLTKKA